MDAHPIIPMEGNLEFPPIFHNKAPLGSIKSWIRRGLLQLRECLDP